LKPTPVLDISAVFICQTSLHKLSYRKDVILLWFIVTVANWLYSWFFFPYLAKQTKPSLKVVWDRTYGSQAKSGPGDEVLWPAKRCIFKIECGPWAKT